MKRETFEKMSLMYTTRKYIPPTCEACRHMVVAYNGDKQIFKCGYGNFKVSKRGRCVAFKRKVIR